MLPKILWHLEEWTLTYPISMQICLVLFLIQLLISQQARVGSFKFLGITSVLFGATNTPVLN